METQKKIADRKICALVTGHVGRPFGGIAAFYENLLASRLSKDVDVVFLETTGSSLPFLKRGILSTALVWNAIVTILQFLKHLAWRRPDVVHIGTAPAFSFVKHSFMVLLARTFHFPVLLHIHCGVDALVGTSRPVWNRFVLAIMARCSAIIVLSTEWFQIQSKLPEIRFEYIPNCIDTAHYESLSRCENDDPNRPVRVLFLGHIGEAKGIYDLFAAIGIAKGVSKKPFLVDIVGEALKACDLEMSQHQIRSLGLEDSVRLWAPEYGSAKISRYGAADIFVLPSYSEGMPMVILEAMASGLAIIATRVGGIPDMISDPVSGLIVEPRSPAELGEALRRLVDDPHLRFKLGTKAREVARTRFDTNIVAPSFFRLYKASVM